MPAKPVLEQTLWSENDRQAVMVQNWHPAPESVKSRSGGWPGNHGEVYPPMNHASLLWFAPIWLGLLPLGLVLGQQTDKHLPPGLIGLGLQQQTEMLDILPNDEPIHG
jgi:hypothetical protein